MSEKYRILIHCPIGIWHENSYKSIMNLDTSGIETDILFTIYNPYDPKYDKQGKETNTKWGLNVGYKMNKAREIVLKQGYDYLFNIEHDMIVPPDVLKGLLKYAKPNNCVSALYRCRPSRNKEAPLCCKTTNKKWVTLKELEGKETVPLWIISFGCVLIGQKVLEQIEFDGSIDAGFAEKTDKLKIQKLLATAIMCGHADRDGHIYWP